MTDAPKKKPLSVDSPYHHTKLAQTCEQSKDFRKAEIAYKAAVAAADALPLNEYKSHFVNQQAQQHIISRAANDFERKLPVQSMEELEDAYFELLSLPFLTRVQLAGFYARNEAIPEAKEAIDAAIKVGLDPLVHNNKNIRKIVARAEDLRRHLGDVLGPEAVEAVFRANFDKLDTNKDGFVDDKELKKAQLDIGIDEDAQQVIRYLLHNYYDVEKASNDEFGMEISGITKADVHNYEKVARERWKRIDKKSK